MEEIYSYSQIQKQEMKPQYSQIIVFFTTVLGVEIGKAFKSFL